MSVRPIVALRPRSINDRESSSKLRPQRDGPEVGDSRSLPAHGEQLHRWTRLIALGKQPRRLLKLERSAGGGSPRSPAQQGYAEKGADLVVESRCSWSLRRPPSFLLDRPATLAPLGWAPVDDGVQLASRSHGWWRFGNRDILCRCSTQFSTAADALWILW